MKTIEVEHVAITLPDLLRLASEDNVVLRAADGKEFIVAEMGDFSQDNAARRSDRATWRPFVGQVLDIAGGAFQPEITEYRENTGEVRDRSLETLLKWAASKGVVLPEYVRIITYPRDTPLMDRGRRVPAKYFTYRALSREDRI